MVFSNYLQIAKVLLQILIDIGVDLDIDDRCGSIALTLYIVFCIPPEHRDLQLLISDNIVLFAEHLPDRLLLLLEARLQEQQCPQYPRELLISQNLLRLMTGGTVVQLLHQLSAFFRGGLQGVLSSRQFLLERPDLGFHLQKTISTNKSPVLNEIFHDAREIFFRMLKIIVARSNFNDNPINLKSIFSSQKY